MIRKGYSVEQIVSAVKQHEMETSADEVVCKLGIAGILPMKEGDPLPMN